MGLIKEMYELEKDIYLLLLLADGSGPAILWAGEKLGQHVAQSTRRQTQRCFFHYFSRTNLILLPEKNPSIN